LQFGDDVGHGRAYNGLVKYPLLTSMTLTN
jgi:hypothetical protein